MTDDRSFSLQEVEHIAARAAAEALKARDDAAQQQAAAPAQHPDRTFLAQLKNPPGGSPWQSAGKVLGDDEETIAAVAKQIQDEAAAMYAARKAREGSR